MRLRARAVDGGTGTTIKLQIPSSGTLNDLRNALSESIGVPAGSIRLSLNKRDEIQGDETAPLVSFGICPGDLIYYFGENIRAAQIVSSLEKSGPSEKTIEKSTDIVEARRQLCASAADKRANETGGSPSMKEYTSSRIVQENNTSTGTEPKAGPSTLLEDEHEMVEVDAVVDPENFRSHIPSFLSRLLAQENGIVKEEQGYLVLAVHGVMLEMGFLAGGKFSCDSTTMVVLNYTLPGLENQDFDVNIRCQSMGNFVVLYGTVAGSSQVYRLSLAVSDYLRTKQEDILSRFKDVFALWKEIKDRLTLPLLILVCERAGLPLPANFQLLPTELKMKVLELLSPTGLATVACVSSELRFLASSEPLWKAKFITEFNWTGENKKNWKLAFAQEWVRRRRPVFRRRNRTNIFPYHFRRPPTRPLPFFPGIIGGESDLFPFGAGGPPVGSPRPNFFPAFRRPSYSTGSPGDAAGAASSGISSSLMMNPLLFRTDDEDFRMDMDDGRDVV